MEDLRTHGITKNPLRFKESSYGLWYYEQQVLGFNYRLTDIQAALGISQIKRLDKFIKKRNLIRKTYIKKLKHLPLSPLEIPKEIISACHLFIIKLENNDSEFHKKIFNSLRKANIGVQLHYIPIHLQPYFKNLGFKKGDFPNAEAYSRNAISLPMYTKLSSKNQKRVIKTLDELFN